MRQFSHSLQSWYVFTAQYLQNFPYFSTFHGIHTNIIHRREINSILMSTTCSPIPGELLNPGHISRQPFKVGAVQIWLLKYQTSTYKASWFLCKKAYTTCEQSSWLKLNSEHLVVTFLHAFQLESKQLHINFHHRTWFREANLSFWPYSKTPKLFQRGNHLFGFAPNDQSIALT